MDDLELLATGRDADVFALGEDRVLLRYRDGGDAAGLSCCSGWVSPLCWPPPR